MKAKQLNLPQNRKLAEKIRQYFLDKNGVDIKVINRKRVVVESRALFYKYMRDHVPPKSESLSTLASFTGQDHASALHALGIYEQKKTTLEPLYNELVDAMLGVTHTIDPKDKIKVGELQERLQDRSSSLKNKELALERSLSQNRNYEIKIARLEAELKELKKDYQHLNREYKEFYNQKRNPIS